MSDTSASTSPADLTPADDAWRFTVDNQPTTDDIAAIEQMLAENLGLDIDEVRAMDLDGDDPADADVPLSDVIANPPTAGDVMGSDDLSDDQDVDVDLAPPTADVVDDPQSAPQAGDTGAGTATTPAPEPTGDLIWRDADANGTDADATAGHDFEDPGEQAASPLPADSGVLDTYFRVAYGEEDPRRAIDAIEQNLQVVYELEAYLLVGFENLSFVDQYVFILEPHVVDKAQAATQLLGLHQLSANASQALQHRLGRVIVVDADSLFGGIERSCVLAAVDAQPLLHAFQHA